MWMMMNLSRRILSYMFEGQENLLFSTNLVYRNMLFESSHESKLLRTYGTAVLVVRPGVHLLVTSWNNRVDNEYICAESWVHLHSARSINTVRNDDWPIKRPSEHLHLTNWNNTVQHNDLYLQLYGWSVRPGVHLNVTSWNNTVHNECSCTNSSAGGHWGLSCTSTRPVETIQCKWVQLY